MDKKTPRDISKKLQHVAPATDNSGKFKDDIAKCIEVLKAGGVILYPTDTEWAIGCDATNEAAVKKVNEIVQHDESLSIFVLVEHANRLGRYIKLIPEVAVQLIEVNDKPMTIIYPGAVNLAGNIIAKDGSLGFRITSDEFCKKLIATFNKPIVSTSANISQEPAPENFRDIDEPIKTEVDYVVKWRQKDPTPGVSSSVIKVGLKGEIQIIHP
jgi:L-threonylcarbamoyladenylate synthase